MVLAGCGGPQQPVPARTSPPVSVSPALAPSLRVSKDKELAASTSRPAFSGGAGIILRGELRQVLSAGAQAFVQRVRIRPAFRHGQFFGWRVIGYDGPGQVQAGDIVRRVNGRSIERPEQWMEAWNGLARSSELRVDVVRRGRPLVLLWPIVD